MVTLRNLELHPGLNDYSHHAVADAVKDIVGVQFRNMATVGGSIWGRFGFSDVLTVFLAMDTYVQLYQGGIIPLRQFIEMKKDRASIGARPSHAILLSAHTTSSAADFAAFVAEHTPTGGNLRGSAAYRTHLIRVLTERCMTELGGM